MTDLDLVKLYFINTCFNDLDDFQKEKTYKILMNNNRIRLQDLEKLYKEGLDLDKEDTLEWYDLNLWRNKIDIFLGIHTTRLNILDALEKRKEKLLNYNNNYYGKCEDE